MKSIRLLLIGIGFLGLVSPSFALFREYSPRRTPTQQAVLADVIIVGRIVEIEDTDSLATTQPGASQKTGYKIANIQIKEALVGAKGLTHIRVGFIPTNQPQSGINDEGCFFLDKHHDGDFYVPVEYGNRLDSKQQDYEGELGNIKRMIQAFEQPIEALKAKKLEDRQFAVDAIIKKYKANSDRRVRKEVELSKEEGNLIFKVLGEMDNDADQLASFASLLPWLQLTERDGWIQPKLDNQVAENNKKMKAAFDTWHKTHGEKYRMKKWVDSKK